MSASHENSSIQPQPSEGRSVTHRLLLFSPLLLLYILVTLIGAHLLGAFHDPIWDESRYLGYAANLLEGFYSPHEDINLANGPGYPLFLAPLVAIGLPLIGVKLFNALFIFGATLYLYATLRRWTGGRTAVVISYLFGLHFPLLSHLPLLYTESFIALQMGGFVFHYLRLFDVSPRWKRHLPAAVAWLAALALTKVFFGYVLLTTLLLSGVLWLVLKHRSLRVLALICGLALTTCLPYLVYTYSLTGKLFYWSTYGGASLYWMSSPLKGDHGDWMGNSYDQVASRAHNRRAPELLEHHGPFFQSLEGLNELERDEAFRAKALHNIREFPLAYLGNWVANLGRLFFEYPFSHLNQTMGTYLFMLPNSFLFVALVCALPLTWRQRHSLPEGLLPLILVAAVTIGGSSLLSAYFRQMIPVFPILFLWGGLVLSRSIQIRVD